MVTVCWRVLLLLGLGKEGKKTRTDCVRDNLLLEDAESFCDDLQGSRKEKVDLFQSVLLKSWVTVEGSNIYGVIKGFRGHSINGKRGSTVRIRRWPRLNLNPDGFGSDRCDQDEACMKRQKICVKQCWLSATCTIETNPAAKYAADLHGKAAVVCFCGLN